MYVLQPNFYAVLCLSASLNDQKYITEKKHAFFKCVKSKYASPHKNPPTLSTQGDWNRLIL